MKSAKKRVLDTGAAPSQKSKSRRPERINLPYGEHGLCDICQKLDFNKILDSRVDCRTVHALHPLHIALQQSDCSFCQFIVAAAKSHLDQSPGNGTKHVLDAIRNTLVTGGESSQDVFCSVTCYAMDNDIYPRQRDVATYHQPTLQFRQSSSLMRTQTASASIPEVPVKFDQVGASAGSGNAPNSHVLRRRLVPNRFDTDHLSLWLTQRIRTKPVKAYHMQQEALKAFISVGRFRLFDVLSNELVTVQAPNRYIALSYVWGRLMAAHVASSNILQSFAMSDSGGESPCLNPKAMPLTIRDAIALVRVIGERYLWTDALCVDQLDSEDRNTNIAHMGTIFENSYFTIIAASGDDADAGLAGMTSDRPSTEILGRIGPDDVITVAKQNLRRTVRLTKWASRAWTFQERSLSRRCVYFTKNEVLFHSGEFEAREAYELTSNSTIDEAATPRGLTRAKKIAGLYDRLSRHRSLDLSNYQQAVEEYSRRDLTYATDRLDAFAGVLERFFPSRTPNHAKTALSGLLMKPFVFQLCWYLTNPETAVRIAEQTRNGRYLPSWSWAGWEGQVDFGLPSSKASIDSSRCEVIDAANITCNLSGRHWEAKPSLVALLKPLRVMLHLFAMVIDCQLIEADHVGTFPSFGIHIVRRGEPESRIPLTQVTFGRRSYYTGQANLHMKHRLVWINLRDGRLDFQHSESARTIRLLLVEGDQEVYERLEYLEMSMFMMEVSQDLYDYAHDEYIRLR